jgi:hypothetical protein
MSGKLKRPSPAFVIALVALFVALSGTAVAAGVVPLAKRALMADNATKLQGQTAAKLVQQASQAPGPASSASGLISQKTASDSVGPKTVKTVIVSCDGGKKVVGAGWSSDGGAVFDIGNRPTGDGTWSFDLMNLDDAQASNVSVYIVCVG